MKKFRAIVQSPVRWLWIGALGYNINKFYLRFLSMEMNGYGLATDALPNFLIVIIVYFKAVLVKPTESVKNYSKLNDYGIPVYFAVLLSVE